MWSDTLDMGIGDPLFMHEYWKLIEKLYEKQTGKTTINITDGMTYDYNQTWEPLKNEIRKLHKLIGNAETDGYEIVLGHGISQLISASVYALTKQGAMNLYVDPPYWPRFEFLGKLGCDAANEILLPTSKSMEIITIPNNPNGSMTDKKSGCDYAIHDLCYFWPQYCTVHKRKDDLMLFGLSKATGHAGTRLGWALAKDAATAQHMRQFVMLSTSGVSTDAQRRAHDVISSITKLNSHQMLSCFETGKEELAKRWRAIDLAMIKNKDFRILNNSGIFAWCQWNESVQGGQAFLKKYNIQGLEGATFGNNTEDFSKFRLNIGCDKHTFDEFIQRISDE